MEKEDAKNEKEEAKNENEDEDEMGSQMANKLTMEVESGTVKGGTPPDKVVGAGEVPRGT